MQSVIVSALVWLSIVASAAAQDLLTQQRAALKEIRDTANDICYTVKQEGQQSDRELSAAVQAQVNGVIAKIVNLNVSTAGKLKNSEYQGVIRSELAQTLMHSEDCKHDVFNKLYTLMLVPLRSQGTTPSTSFTLSYPDGSVYRGRLVEGRPEGDGVLTYKSGAVVEANFVNGVPTGKITLKYPNGDLYYGQVKDMLPEGFGVYTFGNGTSVTSIFGAGKPSMRQIIKYPNGNVYDGYVNEQEIPEGSGTLTFANNGVITGRFVAGIADGSGDIKYPDGSHYEGELKAGIPNGRGSLTYSNGIRIEGSFVNGSPESPN